MLAILSGVGCAPGSAPARDQWTVVIGTDAPVPQFGERLFVDVIDGSGEAVCSACSRQFSVSVVSDWPVSFGVVPTSDGRELRVRAQLFRADHIGFDGLPIGGVLEAIGTLPSPVGVTRVAMDLKMDCFGIIANAEDGLSCGVPIVTLAPGTAAEPGSWPAAQATDCTGPLPDGTVCVAGGVFRLGSLHGFDVDERPERLVRVSPFAMDIDEVTVGMVKTLFVDGLITREPAETASDPTDARSACQYQSGSGENDAVAVNCLDHDLAREICAARGMRLPREAEWEWAAGNLGRETTYPWGEDDDVCDLTVVGRGRAATEGFGELDNCRGAAGAEGVPWGPVVAGDDDDITELGIRNLAGNMSEWIEDNSALYDSACWEPDLTLLEDPVCQTGGSIMVNRGGGWSGYPFQARVFERNAADGASRPLNTGLRCVLSR